jgi:hypothetical protein
MGFRTDTEFTPELPRRRFYKEFEDLIGDKVGDVTATTSVAVLENIDDAEQVYDLAVRCGAIATLRKAVTIKPEKVQPTRETEA